MAKSRKYGPGAPKEGLSIVVPLWNEAKGLAHLHERITEVASRLRETRSLATEVVYVNDGSRDDTEAVAMALPAAGLDVQVVSLSRNFGKEAALLAGLDHARLGAVLFMDGDGQHPPSLVETLVGKWLDDGYDVVYTAKAHRDNEPWLIKTGVGIFYSMINWGARHRIPEDAGDFRLLSSRAADALRQLPERNRFFKGLASWIGFKQFRIDYEPAVRAHGKTSWNLWSLLAFSIEGLTSFSVAPLRVASLLGVAIAFVALLIGVWIMVETIFFGKDVPGYPSIAVGIMVLGGAQLVAIGVLGEYIGKLLAEVKGRPVYFVAEHRVKNAEAAAAAEKKRAEAARPGEVICVAARAIFLCADDYGIARGVSGAIRDLLTQGRINATSVMVVADALDDGEVAALKALREAGKAHVGLHFTLTAPFRPLSENFKPLENGVFLPLPRVLQMAALRRLDRASLDREATAQIEAFIARFGSPPDFIDGHQHVQLFPQTRDAVLDAAARLAPRAWLRQCGRVAPFSKRLRDGKGLLLDILSAGFRRAARRGLRVNPAFAGTYDFRDDADFTRLFPSFLDGMPDGGVVMCHPGVVDDELRRLDPLTTLREKEYAYFGGDQFMNALAAAAVELK